MVAHGLGPPRPVARGSTSCPPPARRGDGAVLEVVAGVLGEIRKVKTEAKKSMRATVARLVVTDDPDRLALPSPRPPGPVPGGRRHRARDPHRAGRRRGRAGGSGAVSPGDSAPDTADELASVLSGCRASHRTLLDVVGSLDDATVRRPSRLKDWTVGHVLTHLARNAASHTRMLRAALAGTSVEQYVGGDRSGPAPSRRAPGATRRPSSPT